MRYVRILSFFVATLLLALTALGEDAAVSSKSPSPDVNSPTRIEIGEIVKGRLANSEQTGKYHFWSIDLPVGKYQIVLDVRRADDAPGNVGGTLDWFSLDGVKLGQLLFMNDIDNRFRSIARFEIKKPLRRIIRYSNSYTVSDYWLGLFLSATKVTGPFFVHCPQVSALTIGQPVTALVVGEKAFVRDAYYLVHLSAGDYKVSGSFRRADGTSGNVGGAIRAMGPEGEDSKQVLFINDIGVSSKQISKLSLADDATFIFLARASYAEEYATLDIAPWQDQ